MPFLLLFIVTNTLVVATVAAVTGGRPLAAALLAPLTLAGLALTLRVVVLARPARPTITSLEVRRIVDAAKEETR
jgi:hypothetical protein